MENKTKLLIRKIVLRDVEIKMLDRRNGGLIICEEEMVEILRELEKEYTEEI